MAVSGTPSLIVGIAPPTSPTLFPYQKEAVRQMVALGGRGGLFLDMGCGKTRTAMAVAKVLACRRILVVCPLSAGGVWINEIKKLHLELPAANLRVGTLAERQRRLAHFDEGLALVNYEAYWREPLKSQILRWAPDIVIWDEAHRISHRGTKQSRFAHLLGVRSKYALALTGTPISDGIENLFSIFKAVRPEVFGSRWADFESRYIVKGGYMGYQIVGYRNKEDLEGKLAKFTYRKRKEDVLDLPPKTDVTIPVPLTDRTYYEEMRKLAITTVMGVDPETGCPIQGVALARVVLTNILRLQQIASGFVTLKDGSVAELSHEKESYLADLLEDILAQKEQVAIFCRFKHEIKRVYEVARRAAGSKAALLDGSVSQPDREVALKRITNGEARCIVVQISVGSLGIDLSACSKAIFYGLSYSLTDYLQSRDRLHRIGQRNPVTYYHLLGEKTVDEVILATLQRKEDLASRTLDRADALRIFSYG